jgi:hypothetical protein
MGRAIEEMNDEQKLVTCKIQELVRNKMMLIDLFAVPVVESIMKNVEGFKRHLIDSWSRILSCLNNCPRLVLELTVY